MGKQNKSIKQQTVKVIKESFSTTSKELRAFLRFSLRMKVTSDPISSKVEPYLRELSRSSITGYHTIDQVGLNAYLSPDGTVVNYHYHYYEGTELQYKCGFFYVE